MARKSRSRIEPPRRPSANVIATLAVVVLAVVVIGGVLLFNRSNDSSGANTGTIPSACAAYYRNVTKKLESDYAGRITFVTRDFPLSTHPLAQQSARAAEAAATQGKYREMYHQLYDNYEQWAIAPDGQQVSDDEQRATTLFDTYATAIGLDLGRFHTDLASAAVADRIDTDMAAGEQLGVSSTPTIYVNGTKFEPRGQSFTDVDRELREMIDKALG